MGRHFNFAQLTLLIGVAVVTGGVLIALIYALHKAARRQKEEKGLRAPTPRAENSQAFMLATLQAVIAGLREEQKKTQELLRASETRAEESLRKTELMACEIEQGLLIFDRQGFISLANPAARALLGIDVWSRRRYQDVLGANAELARRVEACLADGSVTRGEAIVFLTPRGTALHLAVTVLPLKDRAEEITGALCLVKST